MSEAMELKGKYFLQIFRGKDLSNALQSIEKETKWKKWHKKNFNVIPFVT